jgi:hypothetical protein
MEMTKESWDAMVQGQVRDVARINDLQVRLCKMALQVERLSFMVEYMSRAEDEGTWAGPNVEEAEEEWTVEMGMRYTL